tara:strand:+ start:134203 stop:135516 length:1314 start_codon:yes stop_codon:yes gene_type:complete
MEDKRIINTNSVRRPARYRGALTSSDYNDSQEEIITDIQELSNVVNSLNARLTRSTLILNNENAHLRRQVNALREQQEFQEKTAVDFNTVSHRFVDFSNTEGISFPNGLDDTKSAMLAAEYGEVTLPANSIENKFYTTSLVSNKLVTPPLNITVSGTFDKGTGDGLVNYEKGGKIYKGKSEHAFNGVNDLYWVRKVEFPLDSRVDEVECELTVVVPEGSSSNSNLLDIIPYPNGALDVTELATASDLGNNFIRVDGFEPKDNLIARRYHFPSTVVDQVKIRLRQRNWVEENGKKVFYVGLQELGLKLVDYDKQFTAGASFGGNNSFIIAIPAVEGTTFKSLYSITGKPNFLAEDFSQRHIHVRLCASLDFNNNVLWDSDTDLPPQQTTQTISVNNSIMYAFVQMNYVKTTGGVSSPFPVGTTPFLHGFGLSYSLGGL